MVKGVGGKSGCLIKTTPSRLIFHVHPIFPGVTKLCASTIFFLTKIMGRHIISFEKKGTSSSSREGFELKKSSRLLLLLLLKIESNFHRLVA